MTQHIYSDPTKQPVTRKRWSDSERATVIAMARSGAPYWEIRRRTGRTEDSIGKVLRDAGVKLGRSNAQRALAMANSEDNWDADAAIASQRLASAIVAYLERRAA